MGPKCTQKALTDATRVWSPPKGGWALPAKPYPDRHSQGRQGLGKRASRVRALAVVLRQGAGGGPHPSPRGPPVP